MLERIHNHRLEEAHYNERMLSREVAEHQHKFSSGDPLLSRVAWPGLESKDLAIPDDLWQAPGSSAPQACASRSQTAQAIAKLQQAMDALVKASKVGPGDAAFSPADLESISRLTMNMHCWQRAVMLCQQLWICGISHMQPPDDPAENQQISAQLAQLCNMLSDSPAVRFEAAELSQNAERAQAVLTQLLEEQATFRADVLLRQENQLEDSRPTLVHQHFIYRACEDFSSLKAACRPIEHYLGAASSTLLAIYPGLQQLMQWRQVLSAQIQSLPEGLDCSLQPLQLQLCDIAGLLAPEDVTSTAVLSCCYSEVEGALTGSISSMSTFQNIQRNVAKLSCQRPSATGSLCAFGHRETGSNENTAILQPELYASLAQSAQTFGKDWWKVGGLPAVVHNPMETSCHGLLMN